MQSLLHLSKKDRIKYKEIISEIINQKQKTPEKPKALADNEKELKEFIFSKDKTKSSKATGKSLFDELLKLHESILKNKEETEEVSKIKELKENQKVLEEKLETRIEKVNIANEKKEANRTSQLYFLLRDYIEIETDIASLKEQDPNNTEKINALEKEKKGIINDIKTNQEAYKDIEDKTLKNFVNAIVEDKAVDENLFKEIKTLKTQIAGNKKKITEIEERIAENHILKENDNVDLQESRINVQTILDEIGREIEIDKEKNTKRFDDEGIVSIY